MIGRRVLSDHYVKFLATWGAPYGHQEVWRLVGADLARRLGAKTLEARCRGPFGFQPDNNATRYFEYPWAFFAVPVGRGDVVVEVGGSCAGLQFVLSSCGATVLNVDPSTNATMGWPVDQATIATLNRAFKTTVELRKAFLHDAGIKDESVDRVYCISTIEHIPSTQLPQLAHEMYRILKVGGYAVLTIDLFYDLAPFTSRDSNMHGTNIDVRWFVEQTGLELFFGDPSELFGYDEFDPESILSRAMEFTQGNIAVNVAQSLVLVKSAPSDE